MHKWHVHCMQILYYEVPIQETFRCNTRTEALCGHIEKYKSPCFETHLSVHSSAHWLPQRFHGTCPRNDSKPTLFWAIRPASSLKTSSSAKVARSSPGFNKCSGSLGCEQPVFSHIDVGMQRPYVTGKNSKCPWSPEKIDEKDMGISLSCKWIKGFV